MTPNAYTALFSDPSARDGIDLFYTVWYLSSPDPLEMYSVLRTGEFSNYGEWSDPEFDQVVNEAIAIDDPAARSEKTAEAQHIANEQLPWLPLFDRPDAALPRRADHGRRALDRVPLPPVGGHNWRSLVPPGAHRPGPAERRSRRPRSAGSSASSAPCSSRSSSPPCSSSSPGSSFPATR